MLEYKYIKLYFFILLFFICLSAIGQEENKLSIIGTVTHNDKPLKNASITIFKNNEKIDTRNSDFGGEFDILFQFDNEYKLEITKPGFVTKRFLFKTELPKAVPQDIDYSFEFIIGLFPEFNDPGLKILEKPLGIIRFDYDKENFITILPTVKKFLKLLLLLKKDIIH
jgi:hypothetical protein